MDEPGLEHWRPPKRVDWYVVFTPAERDTWFTRFLHPDYGHCYMVRHDGWNWVRIRPNLGYCAIEVLPIVDSEAIEQVVLGGTAVYVEVEPEPEWLRIPWLITLATCTEACKSVLGIRAPWVITPRQLYQFLLRRGHERRGRRRDDAGTAPAAEPSIAGVRQGEGRGTAPHAGAGSVPAGQDQPDDRGGRGDPGR